jgi:phosphoribosyl-dephospho-CoA transferase
MSSSGSLVDHGKSKEITINEHGYAQSRCHLCGQDTIPVTMRKHIINNLLTRITPMIDTAGSQAGEKAG